MVGKGGRSSLAQILVDQSWLGCFPMALPDQLATLAVLLADKKTSGSARGVRSHSRRKAQAPSPSMPFPPGDVGPSPEYPLVCGAHPAGRPLEPTTSNEDMETDGKQL